MSTRSATLFSRAGSDRRCHEQGSHLPPRACQSSLGVGLRLVVWLVVVLLGAHLTPDLQAQTVAVSTLAGSGFNGFADATGTAAQFNFPSGVAVDAAGNVYVADSANHRIRKVTAAGVVSTFAFMPGSINGFYFPSGVAVDSAGNVYVADNHRIRKVTAAGIISTLAGSSIGNSGFVDGAGTAAMFAFPSGVAVDTAGNVYVADSSNNRIRKITAAGVVSTLAGSGVQGFADGAGTAARFNYPSGVAVDAAGNVYVADRYNARIRKITTAGMVSTVAGSGASGFADGTGTAAQFYYPSGVAVDAAGNVYVADANNNRIRKITAAGVVSTFAGSGAYGFSGGTGTAATFFSPFGVAVDAAGNVYVADTNNDAIRLLVSLVAPAFTNLAQSATLTTGEAYLATLTASGNPASTFSVQSGTLPTGLTLNTRTGVLSGTPTVAGTFSGVFAASNLHSAAGQMFVFTVNPAPVLTLSILAGGTFMDGPSTAAKFYRPRDVAVDAAGNAYVADTSNHRIRKITSAGVVSTLAGSGVSGFADATGTAAMFAFPSGVAVDGAGNVYIADSSNHRIRKITAAGVVTTLAGSGTSGFADGTGTAARFAYPSGVAVDPAGNVFIADRSNNRIRKITAAGVVSTLAGSGFSAFGDGTGTAAHFYFPRSVAVDTAGNVYVADTDNHRVRKITTSGEVSTLAGSGDSGFADGTGTTAQFFYPSGATVDAAGNVYVADSSNNQVRKISADGVVSTFAGSGTFGFADDVGTAAQFYSPSGVAVDGAGNVYVADPLNDRIRKISVIGVVGTLAGSGTSSFADGTGPTAQFFSPSSVAVDAAGNVYVADTNNHRIRKVTAAGIVSTLAGSGTSGFADGTGIAAMFASPLGVAVDAAGNVYVADTHNYRIRKITSAGVVSTLAGSGSFGFGNGTGTAAIFSTTIGVAVDGAGNVYVADAYNNRIRKITAAGVVSTLAGSGASAFSDGTGTAAHFYSPRSVAVDAAGNVYVADNANHRIRKITAGGVVSTLAGSGIYGFADGIGTTAQFNRPYGVAVDAVGNVYVADHDNNRIRKITAAGVVRTLAGSGALGFADGTDTATVLAHPSGVTVDAEGNIYIADSDNNAIRVLVPLALSAPAFTNQALSPTFTTRVACAATLTASGNPAPTFSVQSGALPTGLTLNTDTGALGGTPSVAGTFVGVFAATNSQGTATQAFGVTVNAAVVPFTTWASGAGLSGGDAAPTATPFHDGVQNLLKYAFNMNGAGPDASILTPTGTVGLPLLTTTTSGGQTVVVIEFLRRRGSSLVYEAQESTDLVSFGPLVGTLTATTINGDWERVTVEAAAIAAPRRFFRVQVTQP